MRYWIGVVSSEHVLRGVDGGFAQLGHGKEAPLRRLAKGDWLVYYSPRESHPGFQPWRRVEYAVEREVPADHLLDELEVVPARRGWGLVVRRGLVEIGRRDFERIATAMLGQVPEDG